MSTSADVKFVHPNGRANVRPALDAVLRGATRSLRAAVCFFTEPGRILLSRHIPQLKRTDSYFVASVDFPTNLKSLAALHSAAPEHVCIHLGGTTPEEKTVSRSLMHSKLFLAEGDQDSSLWVGSHNLTAMAVNGGNFEAGLLCTAPIYESVMQDALAHLDTCRVTAELFDPRDMDRYEEIQQRHRKEPDWDSEQSVLVIHAEAAQIPTQVPFIVNINVVPTQLDRLFKVDRPVRLFLHTPGTLRTGTPVDYRKTTLWKGKTTGVVRTERHSKNQGAGGEFRLANFIIDIPNVTIFPTLKPSGPSSVKPKTQAVIRLDEMGEAGAEFFSIAGRSPIENVLATAGALQLHEVDEEFTDFFTPESVERHTLIYRPVAGVQQNLCLTGFEETVRTKVPDQDEKKLAPPREEAEKQKDFLDERCDSTGEKQSDEEKSKPDERIRYEFKAPQYPIEPFFFLSNYAIRPRRRE